MLSLTVLVVYTATFDGGLTEQAELMKEIGKYVDAVVIITNQICHMDEVRPTDKTDHRFTADPTPFQSDDVWLTNVQKLMDLTGDIPLGLYETPVPQVR